MKKLHLEIDKRHAGYITPSLARTLELATLCLTLEQAENMLRAATPRTWWAVARTRTAVVVSHLWRGREPILCATVVQRPARGS